MSWPVRASHTRVINLRATIVNWIVAGDPPFLGGIPRRCASIRTMESRGRLLRIAPPPALERSHARLVRAYAAARAGCPRVERIAHAASAALRNGGSDAPTIQANARKEIVHFDGTTLGPFEGALFAWRWEVLNYAVKLGVAPPAWVRELV